MKKEVVMTRDEYEKRQYERWLCKVASLSKNFFGAVKKLDETGKKYKYIAIMLTFRDNTTFVEAKTQVGSAIKRYITEVQTWVKRHGGKIYAYFWVLEVQSRGVPHYHIFFVTDKHIHIPFPDRSYWKWGFSGLKILSRDKISKSYLAKYLYKSKQKDFFSYKYMLYKMKKYYLWVCRELKQFFFDVLVSRYGFLQCCLSKLVGRFVVKRKGVYEIDDGIFVKSLNRMYFVENFVIFNLVGYKVCIDGDSYIYEDVESLLRAVEFVYA